MKTVSKIVVFTRPWEVKFHLQLCKLLSQRLGVSDILFVSFFIESVEEVERSGFQSKYMPELLAEEARVDSDNGLEERVDREVSSVLHMGLHGILGMERFRPKGEAALAKFLSSHVRVMDKIISDGTLSICSMFDHFVYVLAGALVLARNGAHFSFVGSGCPPKRTIALKTPWTTWNVPCEDEAAASLLVKARNALDQSIESRIDYMLPVARSPFMERMVARLGERRGANFDRASGSYFQPDGYFRTTLINSIVLRIRRLSVVGKERYFRLRKPGDLTHLRAEYVYYPLHLEPEASILMYSPWLRDQLEVCRLLSQSLPVHLKLVVKENPKMLAERPISFYKSLLELPNVVLAHPELSSIEIMRGSLGVASLSGTAALEALLLSKPSLLLAEPPFSPCVPHSNLAGKHGYGLLPSLFNEWSEGKPFVLDFAAWKKWVEATFSGNLVPKNTRGRLEIECNDNVANAANYIVGAISLCA